MAADNGSASNHDSIIDITKAVAYSITKNPLWSHGFRQSPKSCIFTVPNSLSKHNPEAYKPKFISIGPLHHSDKHLKDSRNIKFQYLSDLVSRVGVLVEDMITAVAELEQEAREHYGEQINLSQVEFVEIMVLDGCFIIEYLRKFLGVVKRKDKDPVIYRESVFQDLKQDVMLLENQIPWMILHQLFTMTRSDEEIIPGCSVLHHLTIHFINNTFDLFENSREDLALCLQSVKCNHILDLARYVLIFLTTSSLHNETTRAMHESIPTATELENAGVTLKRSQSEGLSISFKDGVLEMTRLQIFDETECLFRNLIALEQCSTVCPTLISSYASILKDLIKKTEDISCMSNDIIDVHVSPDDVLGFFNKLGNGVVVSETMYPKIAAPLNKYIGHRWPRWRATLIQNYFGNPWVITSTLAAFVLLVLTFLQTLYTMKG